MGEELKPVVRGGLFKGPIWAVRVDGLIYTYFNLTQNDVLRS